MNVQIDLYCDGACSGNPGPGGFAFTLIAYNPETKEALKTLHGNGYELHTTNQRMELHAAIAGLKALTAPTTLRVISDSKYLIDGMREWVNGWQQNGWRNKKKQPVANQDLWLELVAASQRHSITWMWTKGHASDTSRYSHFNNLVDEEAAKQRDLAKRLGTGTEITVERAYATADSGSDETLTFAEGKLVALNGDVVTRIESRKNNRYMVYFTTHAREAQGEDKLYVLP